MNTVPEYTEEIARLILQRISGTIGEEEAGLLDAWRKADPANEETYRRLLDSAFLEREWRRSTLRGPWQICRRKSGEAGPAVWWS